MKKLFLLCYLAFFLGIAYLFAWAIFSAIVISGCNSSGVNEQHERVKAYSDSVLKADSLEISKADSIKLSHEKNDSVH